VFAGAKVRIFAKLVGFPQGRIPLENGNKTILIGKRKNRNLKRRLTKLITMAKEIWQKATFLVCKRNLV